MDFAYHTPVLVNEVVQYLVTKPDGVYVDATLGGGGHTEAILDRLSATGRVIGLDRDGDALAYAEQRLRKFVPRVVLVRENFALLRNVLDQRRIPGVDGILLDVGVSSFQIDQPGKGFSFQRDERLDMRMDTRQGFDAVAFLRTVDERELERVIREYGEERHAKRIARMIIRERISTPLTTTVQLATLVRRAAGGKFAQKSVARVFQALRIAVNGELQNLRNVLHDSVDVLNEGGRIVVITYHSLEDRIVKQFFKDEAGVFASHTRMIMAPDKKQPRLRILTKKPITPSQSEIDANRRSRSAKMRVAEKV